MVPAHANDFSSRSKVLTAAKLLTHSYQYHSRELFFFFNFPKHYRRYSELFVTMPISALRGLFL